MIDKVREFIKKEALLRRGDTVCVAVSGGVDSTVLLYLLNSIKVEMELKLVVCHLNHNFRGKEAACDRNFVKKLASRFGLEFEEGKLLKKDIMLRRGESLQEWARGRRLAFLGECADKHSSHGGRAPRIALGHNMDDQSETILMRLMKGASLRGLCGIAPKRERFIRPILGLTRAAIEAFAMQSGIDFVEDSSNKTDKYLRNRIRHELIPLLANYNPLVREAMARGAKLLREDEVFLQGAAEAAFKEALIRKTKRQVAFARSVLLGWQPSILRRVFIKAVYSLKSEAEQSVYLAQVDAFMEVVKGRAPNTTQELCRGLFVSRDYDNIMISTKPPKAVDCTEAEVVLSVPGRARLEPFKATISATTSKKPPKDLGKSPLVAYFDLALLTEPLTVRTFRAGDRMCLLGMSGRKKLKDIFIDEKLSLDKRRATLLVLSGIDIIWVAGLRRSTLALVTAKTRKVLKLTLIES